jgi:TPR repeat protein
MTGELASALMGRGQDFLRTGDIAAARILFGRLAAAGIADGTFALAETYDGHYLAAHKVLGVVGDESKARAFYQQAAQLGSVEAAHMLEQTISK